MDQRTLQPDQIARVFTEAFGDTTLNDRIQDILSQASSLSRYSDLGQLRDEAGDLLCSLIQLCNECGWSPNQLIDRTLTKIESRCDIYQRLGRKLRVALYTGAFDPVHIGHLQVAQSVLAAGMADEVWLMPCFDHLSGKAMLPAEARLQMCRLATEDVAGLSVFDYEIVHEFRGETYHLVKKLLNEDLARLRCDFSMIIGQDIADAFATWTNHEALERLIPFIVVPREEAQAPENEAWYLKEPHRFLAGVRDGGTISSTVIKQLLAKKDPKVKAMLPERVYRFIEAQGLYQSSVKMKPIPARRIALYSRSFDPPTRSQQDDVMRLLGAGFDEVVICPIGPKRSSNEHQHASPLHRAALVTLGFRGLAGANIDYDDISQNHYSTAIELEERHRSRGEVWHVLDAEQIDRARYSGMTPASSPDPDDLRRSDARWVVLHPNQQPPAASELRQGTKLLARSPQFTSAQVRQAVYSGDPIDVMVTPLVERYIHRHQLFLPYSSQRFAFFKTELPKLLIVADPRNAKSMTIAEQYKCYESDDPDLVLVLGGDGTMLHAIREHWRLRVPFVGVNTGHLGFLMNERLPLQLDGLELLTYTLPMLRVDAESPSGERSVGLAFSDVWVERAEGQAAWIRLDVDGETRLSKIVGDGMLVATASGSSAYARAMGAVPVPLNTPTLTLAGSNIFQPRFWKPMTLPDESLVTLASLDRSGKRPVRSFLDGTPMGIVQQLTIKRSLTASVELAFTREFDPAARLLRSLFPPEEN